MNRVLNLISSQHAPANPAATAARPEKPDDSLRGRDASRSDVNDRLCFAVKNAQQSISVVLTAASHSVRREAAICHYALRYAPASARVEM